MIRSFNHSSYPRIGDHPLDQQVRTILRRRERGRATDEEVTDVVAEVTTIAVAEQSRAFIDVVTDGRIAWSGPQSHLADHLEGLDKRELRPWLGTCLLDRRVAVTGAIHRREPFLVKDYEVAVGVADMPVLVTLPGPVTFARLAADEHYGDLDTLADAVAAALAGEVSDLAAAGARFFRVDEPMLCSHAEDLPRVARTAARVFEAAGEGATTILGTSFGDLRGVADDLQRIPGTHLGLDLACGAGNLEVLSRLPEGRGVCLGVFDARTTRLEDAADVAARLEPHRASLVERDVLVGPNTGLELLPRDQAFEKLLHARYLVEKLREEWPWS